MRGTGPGNGDGVGCPCQRAGISLEHRTQREIQRRHSPSHLLAPTSPLLTPNAREVVGNQNYLGHQIPEKVSTGVSSPRRCMCSGCVFLYGEKSINERVNLCLSLLHWGRVNSSQEQLHCRETGLGPEPSLALPPPRGVSARSWVGVKGAQRPWSPLRAPEAGCSE